MSPEPRAGPALWPLGIAAAAVAVGLLQWSRPREVERADAYAAARAAPTAGGVPTGAPATTTGAGVAPAAVGLECPPQQLPDDGVCIPVPPPEDSAATSTPIELLPGRTADYARYVTPIARYPAKAAPDELGLYVAAPRGVPVTAVSLEAQLGPTRRWVTATKPPRLLTLHRVERSGSTRIYVLAYEGVAFDTLPGMNEVAVGTPLGRVAPGPGSTGLRLRVRQLRRGIEPENLPPERLLLDASSLACDPRNVLPLQPAP